MPVDPEALREVKFVVLCGGVGCVDVDESVVPARVVHDGT